MITTCPKCQTAFQITAEQLSAKAGLVRCGACREVFNGYRALTIVGGAASGTAKPATSDGSATQQPAAKPAPQDKEASIARGSLLAPLEPTDASVPAAIAEAEALLREPMPGSATTLDFLLDDASAPPPQRDLPHSKLAEAAPRAAAISPPAAPVEPLAWGEADAKPNLRPRRRSGAAQESAKSTERTARAQLAAEAPTQPMQRAPRAAEPLYQPDLHVAPASPTWWIGSAVLLAALLAQSAFFWRGALAQHWPQTRATLEGVCASVGCTVPYAQDVSRLNIESSALEADTTRPGVVVLQATIQNTAPFMQRYPHLELTLTGVNDEVLGVKMFAPEQYLPNRIEGWRAQQSHALSLPMDVSALPPAGFRLRLMYP